MAQQVTEVRLGDIIGAPYNPRRIDKAELERLRASIQEWGFVSPVVLRAEDSMLIGGHQRVAALRLELARTKHPSPDDYMVPAVVLEGLTEERTKGLNLALNKISGEWDLEDLASLLGDMSGSVADLAGFSAREVQDILGIAALPPMDKGEAVSAAATTRLSSLVVEFATPAEAGDVAAWLKQTNQTAAAVLLKARQEG